MKKLMMIMAVALLSTAAMAKDFTVRVANLNCQNCANRMEAVLKQSDVVKKVKFDLPSKTVTISYKGKKDNVENIKQLLTDAKFNLVADGEPMPGAGSAKTQCPSKSGGQKGCGSNNSGHKGCGGSGNCHK